METLVNPRSQLPAGRNVYVYGTGVSARMCRSVLEIHFGIAVRAFVDRQNRLPVDGKEVVSLSDFARISDEPSAILILCSQAVREIEVVLSELGIVCMVLDGQAYFMARIFPFLTRLNMPDPSDGGVEFELPDLDADATKADPITAIRTILSAIRGQSDGRG